MRSDLGGENVGIWQYMIEQHMSESVIITGSSTHNERIERLWRDVFRCVISLFYDSFRALEEEGKLDPLNEIDLFCLHFTYIPLINHALEEFTSSWNNHKISTENNLTPNQLFIQGYMQRNDPPTITPHASITGNSQTPEAHKAVTVPRIVFEPCTALLEELMANSSSFVLSVSQSHDFYSSVTDIVGRHLSQGCTECSSE